MAHDPSAFIQEYFRIRVDDTALLNDVFPGGGPAENANATIGTGIDFRIRFKVRETAGGNDTKSFKLQCNFNSGTWVDVNILGNTSSAPAAMCRPSSQFADGDATSTERLTNTSTYVEGEGVAAVVVTGNVLTGSYSLTNEETEFEFLLRILSFFDTPSRDQVQANDTVEFRVVESDGTVFTGTYTNPTITVAETSGFVGSTSVETPNQIMHMDSNDNLYILVEDTKALGNPERLVLKSTDRGAIWRIMDDVNRPTEVDWESCDSQLIDGIIYMGSQLNNDVWHDQFNTSAAAANQDTWQVIDQAIQGSVVRDDQIAAFVRRSDNSMVVFFQEQVGADFRIRYKIKNGSWGSVQELDTTSGSNQQDVVAVLDTSDDRIHIFYNDFVAGNLYHKSLSSADSLGARDTVSSDVGQGADEERCILGAVYYLSGSVDRVVVAFRDDSSGEVYTSKVDDDGSPSAPVSAVDNTIAVDGIGNKRPIGRLVVYGTDLYIVYPDVTNGEIWITKSVDYGSWDTDVKIISDVVCHEINATILEPSAGNVLIGMYFDDSSFGSWGSSWYQEYEIEAGGTDYTRSVSDNVGITDSIFLVLDYRITLTESEGITDTLTLAINKVISFADNVGITDVLSTSVGRIISFADNVGITDTISSVVGIIVSLADSIGITDTVATAREIYKTILDSVGITDTLTTARNIFKTFTDNVGITDILNIAIDKVISIADSVGITDTINSIVKITVSLSDTVGLTDTISKVLNYARTISNTEDITDILSKIGTFKRTFTASVGITDILNISVGRIISIADTVGITDTIATARNLYKTLTNSVGITDTFTKVVGRIIFLSDSVGITDTLATAREIYKTLDNTVGIVDTIVTARGIFITLLDNIGITDTIDAIVKIVVTLSDDVGITDTIATAREIYIILTENEGITDVPSTAREIYKTISNSVGVTDVISTAIDKIILISDTVGITDVIDAIKSEGIIQVLLTSTVGITDALSTARDLVKTISNNLGITDALSTARTLIKQISDTVDAIDLILVARGLFINISDMVGITDTLTVLVKKVVLLVDNIGITDSITTARNIYKTLAENVGITDTLTKIGTFKRTITDNISITDILFKAKVILISISDTVGITDTLSYIKQLLQIIPDFVDHIIGSYTPISSLLARFVEKVGIKGKIDE